MSAGRGYNTFHGFDTGPPPPGFAPTQPAGQHPFPPPFGWPQQPFGWPVQPGFAAPAFPPAAVIGPPMVMPPNVVTPAAVGPPSYPYPYPYGLGSQTHPSMPPVVDPNFPGIHLRNHTGGVGLPPGYDYAFPKEHTKIHAFTTKEKPWQNSSPLWNWDATKHVKLFVPSNTTVKELMQNLGCTNEDAKKNVLHEVTEVGNGKWLKGLTIVGDDKDRVKKAISEFGWDKLRTGNPGERPVVWLYATKD